jgi:hypothetical protein
MRKSRFSETQIVEILQEGERERAAGQGTAPVARHRSRTYSPCKAKYSGAPAGVNGRRCRLSRRCEQRNRDAPVLIAARRAAIRSHWSGLPDGQRLDPIPLDATFDQEAPHLVGPALTEL